MILVTIIKPPEEMFFFSFFILFWALCNGQEDLCTNDSVNVIGADEALGEEGLYNGCYTKTSTIQSSTSGDNYYTRDGIEKDGPFIYQTTHISDNLNNWIMVVYTFNETTSIYSFTDNSIGSYYSNGENGISPENPADSTNWRKNSNDDDVINVDILCGCATSTSSPTSSPTPGMESSEESSSTGMEESSDDSASALEESSEESSEDLCTEDSVYVTSSDESNKGDFDGCYTSTSNTLGSSSRFNFYTRDGLEKNGPFIYTSSSLLHMFFRYFEYDSVSGDYAGKNSIISVDEVEGIHNPSDITDWEEEIEVLCGCPTPSPISRSPTSSGKSDSTPIIAGVSSAIFAFLVISGLMRRHCKNEKTQELPVTELPELPSYEQAIMILDDKVTNDKEPEPVTTSTGEMSIEERNEVVSSVTGPGIGKAVMDSALYLAQNSNVPGVSEVATAISILVNLLSDSKNNKDIDASIRRCRSITTMLNRASKILGKGSETTVEAERILIEDVHDAISDIVELVKTYKSKNKISQLLMSTLFKKRQEEMGAVVDSAILGLQLGLHVQVGNNICEMKNDVGAIKEVYDGSMMESKMESRRARRQRKLEKIEIPEDHVFITEDLLGKGGFGVVYLADYNGRNAAAKVIQIVVEDKSQYKAFLGELSAMNRLRSPYTVNVYGAITSMTDKLVLVMELLSGGDLRTFLKNNTELTDFKEIISDICSGMSFLHSKKTIHGDLKSANVLLDGNGRAKIADFGTSKWTQNTMSTGLVTRNTKGSTQMSLAWSAPEVLDSKGTTYASDVYSFGILIWEILSKETPWACLSHRDVYIQVVLKDMRPIIPDNSPENLSNMAKLCWLPNPEERPTFDSLLESV